MLQHERQQVGNNQGCGEAVKALLIISRAIRVEQRGEDSRPDSDRSREVCCGHFAVRGAFKPV